MKTIKTAAVEADKNLSDLLLQCNTDDMSASDNYILGFEHGAEFVQTWIPIGEELPEKITNPSEQSNGNTLYFYENYLVKGYWMNEARREEVLMATYMPSSVYWYFNVHKPKNTLEFIVTHWRPIKRK